MNLHVDWLWLLYFKVKMKETGLDDFVMVMDIEKDMYIRTSN